MIIIIIIITYKSHCKLNTLNTSIQDCEFKCTPLQNFCTQTQIINVHTSTLYIKSNVSPLMYFKQASAC